MRLQSLDYRYANAVLEDPAFGEAKAEILEILRAAPVPLLDPNELSARRGGVKRRTRDRSRPSVDQRFIFLPVNQKALNIHLDEAFKSKGWQLQPPIVSRERQGGPETGLKGDYKKGLVQVEAQFGNMARWYTDVFKFQLSYSLGEIDVAVLIVPTRAFANLIDENVANFERVSRELPWAKMSLTLPILVIGIEPDDYGLVRQCYERAGETFALDRQQAGVSVQVVPFDTRLLETPEAEVTEDEPATDGSE